MKKLTLVIFFVACMIAIAKQSSAQTPYDLLYGACPEGIYVREDVIDLVATNLVQSIQIGGSVTSWVMKEAKLYGDPANPSNPGYYVLRFKKRLKIGATLEIYIQVDKDIWLPAAAKEFDIFRDEDVIPNDQKTGFNLKVTVGDNITFNFP